MRLLARLIGSRRDDAPRKLRMVQEQCEMRRVEEAQDRIARDQSRAEQEVRLLRRQAETLTGRTRDGG